MSSLRLQRSFVTACAVALAAAIPVSCAVGSSPYDVGGGGSIGAGGAVTTGPGGTTSTSGHVTSSNGGPTTSSSSSTTTSGFGTSSSSSSSTTSGFGTSSSTSSSGGPSSACDTGTCSACGGCAQNATCFNQTLDCELDCDCSNIIACIQSNNCTDNACVDGCRNLYSFGAPTFDALIQCLDCACVQTCAVPAGVCP